MHNLQPPLLHRDLKVENILQASTTSFKLCDFGSAVPTSLRAPSTTAELRALESDLNRHTTLQYRAPEMVDVYLRRPVDEKSGKLTDPFSPCPPTQPFYAIRYLGIGCSTVQIMLLHHTLRGAWTTRYPQCLVPHSPLPRLFFANERSYR